MDENKTDTKPEFKTYETLTLADVQTATVKVTELLRGQGPHYNITPGNWSVSSEDACTVFRSGTSAGYVKIAKVCDDAFGYGPYNAKAIASIPVMLAALELNAIVLSQVAAATENPSLCGSAGTAWRCTEALLHSLRVNT